MTTEQMVERLWSGEPLRVRTVPARDFDGNLTPVKEFTITPRLDRLGFGEWLIGCRFNGRGPCLMFGRASLSEWCERLELADDLGGV